MSGAGELYQEMILDHNRRPRNFRRLEDASRSAEGYNPLCGDQVTIYLDTDGETIRDISFTGSGCAISKASASIMTEILKSRSRAEAEGLFEAFHAMVTGRPRPGGAPGKLSVFAGVAEFPARVKCATLAWHTMRAAFAGQREAVSTE